MFKKITLMCLFVEHGGDEIIKTLSITKSMIKKINIVLANLKNANAAFALIIFIIISQIFAVLLWYWNVGYIGAQWFAISACGNIAGFLMGYRDNDGNELWDEELHLPKKLYGEL